MAIQYQYLRFCIGRYRSDRENSTKLLPKKPIIISGQYLVQDNVRFFFLLEKKQTDQGIIVKCNKLCTGTALFATLIVIQHAKLKRELGREEDYHLTVVVELWEKRNTTSSGM